MCTPNTAQVTRKIAIVGMVLAVHLGVCVLYAQPAEPTAAVGKTHDVKIFNGEQRLFASIGPSTSMGIAPALQRKFSRYTGKSGKECPLQITNFSTSGAQYRMPGWVDCKPSATNPDNWEAIRTPKYLNTVKKLIDDNPGIPVIVISMNCTDYAITGNNGKNRILGPDDTEHINMTANFLRTHINAILQDGATMYFLSPKKYWRAYDDPHEWNHNEEKYAVTKVAAENISGFVYVKGVWEDTAKYKEIALVKDGHHPSRLGSEIMASKFFRAMLEHDGLPVPEWDQKEVDTVRKEIEASSNAK
jgi:hypothetical protein